MRARGAEPKRTERRPAGVAASGGALAGAGGASDDGAAAGGEAARDGDAPVVRACPTAVERGEAPDVGAGDALDSGPFLDLSPGCVDIA